MGLSSDKQKPINLSDSRDLITGSYENLSALTAKVVGYESTWTIDISDLGIENSVIDVDVWFHEQVSAGGGVDNFNYLKMPFTRYATGGTVSDAAYHIVRYQASSPKDGANQYIGPAQLLITYRNNSSSSAGQTFYYKVSTRSILGDV